MNWARAWWGVFLRIRQERATVARERALLRESIRRRQIADRKLADAKSTESQLRAAIKALEHDVRKRDEDIEVLQMNIESLTAIIERDRERVRAETANFAAAIVKPEVMAEKLTRK